MRESRCLIFNKKRRGDALSQVSSKSRHEVAGMNSAAVYVQASKIVQLLIKMLKAEVQQFASPYCELITEI